MRQRDLICLYRLSGVCACTAGASRRTDLMNFMKDQDLCLGGNGGFIKCTGDFVFRLTRSTVRGGVNGSW